MRCKQCGETIKTPSKNTKETMTCGNCRRGYIIKGQSKYEGEVAPFV